MGNALCCCCCKKDPIRPPRRNSSFSDLETIRPPASDIQFINHQEIKEKSPFIDMNPVLLELAFREHSSILETPSVSESKNSDQKTFKLNLFRK